MNIWPLPIKSRVAYFITGLEQARSIGLPELRRYLAKHSTFRWFRKVAKKVSLPKQTASGSRPRSRSSRTATRSTPSVRTTVRVTIDVSHGRAAFQHAHLARDTVRAGGTACDNHELLRRRGRIHVMVGQDARHSRPMCRIPRPAPVIRPSGSACGRPCPARDQSTVP
jgi:hypothetical protein